MSGLVKVNCHYCGKEFEALRYKVAKGLGKYCSFKCTGLAKIKRATFTCKYCGKMVQVRPCEVRKGRTYCSSECMNKGLAEIRCQYMTEYHAGLSAKEKKQRGKKISLWHKKCPKESKDWAERISKAKRERIKNDSEYAGRLKQQALSLPKTTKESARKARKTINRRYTKEQRKRWSSQGGKVNAEKHGGPWNKGLTKETSKKVAAQAKKIVGHKPAKGSGVGKSGYRLDIGHFVRSTWEADVCRLLKYFGIKYLYEPRKFYLRQAGETVDSYLPDLYLPDFELYVEITGWRHPKKTAKLKLFHEQYPDESFFEINKKVFLGLKKMFPDAIQWESGRVSGKADCSSLLKVVSFVS